MTGQNMPHSGSSSHKALEGIMMGWNRLHSESSYRAPEDIMTGQNMPHSGSSSYRALEGIMTGQNMPHSGSSSNRALESIITDQNRPHSGSSSNRALEGIMTGQNMPYSGSSSYMALEQAIFRIIIQYGNRIGHIQDHRPIGHYNRLHSGSSSNVALEGIMMSQNRQQYHDLVSETDMLSYLNHEFPHNIFHDLVSLLCYVVGNYFHVYRINWEVYCESIQSRILFLVILECPQL